MSLNPEVIFDGVSNVVLIASGAAIVVNRLSSKASAFLTALQGMLNVLALNSKAAK